LFFFERSPPRPAPRPTLLFTRPSFRPPPPAVRQGHELAGGPPPEWFAAGAFPSLQNLYLSGNPLGADGFGLPEVAPGALPALSQLRASSCGLEGPLPASWGAAGAMPLLVVLRAGGNALTGGLPREWLAGGALPSLVTLDLSANALSGGLPVWEAAGGRVSAMAALQELFLQDNSFDAGGLPPSWGAPGGAPELRSLNVSANPVGGERARLLL
jgi:hypothetical protein